MRYVTAAEMRQIDRNAIENCGIPASRLMENAGRAVAEEASKVAGKGKALIFAGFGNNGGDGLVACRYLIKKGYEVSVFFVGKPKSLTPETNSNLESLFTLKIQPKFISNNNDMEKIDKEGRPSIIIDAIFGIGIKGSLDDFYIKLIEKINSLAAPIIAVDIPSGLDADSGEPLPVAIKAHTTVTFGYPKSGFKSPEAGQYVGRLVVADIGFPADKGGAIREDKGREGESEKGEEKGEDRGREGKSEIGKEKRKTIRVRSGKKGIIKEGHPWIFRNQLPPANIKPGDIVMVETADGKFIGGGYYNPKSEISIRLLTFKDEPIDKNFFNKRFAKALQKRENLKALTNAYRVIFSEADELPGLIVDLYKDTAIFQVLTLGMEKLKSLAVEGIKDTLAPKYIYEKSASPFRKLEGLKDVKMWHGDKGESIVEIFEGKARFLVDIDNGHKTGFYLDQRRSRLGLEPFCGDKKVLDLFCYTGAFSVAAGLCGARSVLGIDIKDDWLKLAAENAKLNGLSDKLRFVKDDAFSALQKIYDSGERFDIIILDPPSFLKARESLASASKGYEKLNGLAMKTVTDGGMLATFSCSYNMPNETFSRIIKKSAEESGKKISILKRCHQAEDHPIVRAIPETQYLKGYFLKINPKDPLPHPAI